MKATDYYNNTIDRSSAWLSRASEPGYAPNSAVLSVGSAHLKSGRRLLDIGCQGGHQIALIRHRFAEAVGVDIASYSEMWSQFPDVQFIKHDVDSAHLPFPNDYFTSILCTNVLEHVFDVFGLVREIARLLEPGGTTLIEVPNASYIGSVCAILRGRVPRTGAPDFPFTEEHGWDGQHLHLFTFAEFSWLVSHCGMKIDRFCYAGRYTSVRRLCRTFLARGIIAVCSKPGPGSQSF